MNFSTKIESNPVEPRISLGLPVYNGEKFIKKTIDSILTQTFVDFELIISDNASIDSTQEICTEYMKRDNRIRYYRQETNIGFHSNFLFVLNKSHCNYFKWVAVDDILLPDFLNDAVSILESNKNSIGCISRVKRFGPNEDILKPNSKDSIFQKYYKKIKSRLRTSLELVSLDGSFAAKLRTYMQNPTPIFLYGLFRTDVIKKSVVDQTFINNDTAIVLNTLKHGDFKVLDKILMYYYSGGMSSHSIIKNSRIANKRFLGIVFPLLPLSSWFLKELGFNAFLRNLDRLILLNFVVETLLLNEIFWIFIHKLLRK